MAKTLQEIRDQMKRLVEDVYVDPFHLNYLKRSPELIQFLKDKNILDEVLDKVVRIWVEHQHGTHWNISEEEAKLFLSGEWEPENLLIAVTQATRDLSDDDIQSGLTPFKRENENTTGFYIDVVKYLNETLAKYFK